jgi:hypothetical protein
MKYLLLLLVLIAQQTQGQSPGVSTPATDNLGRALPTHEQVGGINPFLSLSDLLNNVLRDTPQKQISCKIHIDITVDIIS